MYPNGRERTHLTLSCQRQRFCVYNWYTQYSICILIYDIWSWYVVYCRCSHPIADGWCRRFSVACLVVLLLLIFLFYSLNFRSKFFLLFWPFARVVAMKYVTTQPHGTNQQQQIEPCALSLSSKCIISFAHFHSRQSYPIVLI